MQWEYCILFLACWDSLSACVGVYIKENEQMPGLINSLPTTQSMHLEVPFVIKQIFYQNVFYLVSPNDTTRRKSGTCALPLEQAVYEEFSEEFIPRS